MKILIISLASLVAVLGSVQVQAQAPAALSATAATPPPAGSATASEPERRTIQQFGLTFVLRKSSRHDGVDTEEYFLQNEAPESWSQMLTYQRIVLPEPMGTDQYVGWLKSHLEQASTTTRLRTVQSGKDASIFGVQYPKGAGTEEQFALALVTIPDSRRPNELHLIQYALQTHRLPVEEMELQVKRWQSRFQSQASSLSRSEGAARP